MKYYLLTILSVFICLGAEAQWYLFPSAKADTTGKTEPALIASVQDSTIVKPDSVRINLFLPLGSLNENPSQAFSDFYCGAMMAVKEAGRGGLNIQLNVIDILSETFKLSATTMQNADLNIGPISYGDIESALAICPEDKYIVSPLEKRVSSLVEKNRIIQAPSGKREQISELAAWVKEDTGFADRVYVLVENDLSGDTGILVEDLTKLGIQYDTVSVISFESVPGHAPAKVVCAIEKDEITGNAIGEIARMNRHGAEISFYGTSGARTLNTVTSTSLQQAKAHICTSYDVEYKKETTRDFVLSFRENFHCEPSQFAFSGYDTVLYFTQAFAEFGNQWVKKLPEFPKEGIQTDFKFESNGSTGCQNIAVKRIIFKEAERSVPTEENSGVGYSFL